MLKLYQNLLEILLPIKLDTGKLVSQKKLSAQAVLSTHKISRRDQQIKYWLKDALKGNVEKGRIAKTTEKYL